MFRKLKKYTFCICTKHAKVHLMQACSSSIREEYGSLFTVAHRTHFQSRCVRLFSLDMLCKQRHVRSSFTNTTFPIKTSIYGYLMLNIKFVTNLQAYLFILITSKHQRSYKCPLYTKLYDKIRKEQTKIKLLTDFHSIMYGQLFTFWHAIIRHLI